MPTGRHWPLYWSKAPFLRSMAWCGGGFAIWDNGCGRSYGFGERPKDAHSDPRGYVAGRQGPVAEALKTASRTAKRYTKGQRHRASIADTTAVFAGSCASRLAVGVFNSHHAFYIRCRAKLEREASPTVCIIDSQSVESAEKEGAELIRLGSMPSIPPRDERRSLNGLNCSRMRPPSTYPVIWWAATALVGFGVSWASRSSRGLQVALAVE